MNYYLGVDIGTSSVKSLLMDATGNIAGTSQIGYDIIKAALSMRNRTWKNFGRLQRGRSRIL
mgnify:CR=1 FL=1